MPITKSAQKALRQAKKRRQRNLLWKNKINKFQKDIKKLIGEKKTGEATKLLPQFYKIVDKAAKINLIHKNTAARKKSRITKLLKTTK